MIRNVPVWFLLSHEVFRLRAAINRHFFQPYHAVTRIWRKSAKIRFDILRFAHVIGPAGSAPVWSVPQACWSSTSRVKNVGGSAEAL